MQTIQMQYLPLAPGFFAIFGRLFFHCVDRAYPEIGALCL
jgi:hypothetical protein